LKLSFLLLLAFVSTSACGRGPQTAPPPIQQETSADEILRISTTWLTSLPEKGILAPPSKISLFDNLKQSEITLGPQSASERFVLHERLELRNGSKITCRTEFNHTLQYRWGRRQGEAALQLVRPQMSGPRSCDAPHPDGDFYQASQGALLVLRSDSLVAVEPLVDKRVYIPGKI